MSSNVIRALIATAAIGAAIAFAGAAFGRTAAVPPRAGSLYVAPGGSDGSGCTRAQPCATFQRAYTAASPGAIVEIAAGSYPTQVINAPPKSRGPNIVFRPAPGAHPVVADVEVTNGSHLEFRDLVVPGDTYNRAGAQYVTYRRIAMGLFFIRGGDHIRYIDSEVGPNNENDYMNWISAAYDTNDPASDIIFDGVRIHDFKKHSDDSHVDCIGIDDVNGLVIRNSHIWHCEHFAIIFGNDSSSDRAARNVLLENNFFDCCYSGYYAIGFGGIDGKVEIRFNSSDEGFGWLNDTSLVPDGLITLDSNVISSNSAANCSRAKWLFNVVGSGTPCGGRHAPTGFRSPPGDLHLTSSAAARRAGNPRAFPARDIDGNRRLKGRRPDAGADQVR